MSLIRKPLLLPRRFPQVQIPATVTTFVSSTVPFTRLRYRHLDCGLLCSFDQLAGYTACLHFRKDKRCLYHYSIKRAKATHKRPTIRVTEFPVPRLNASDGGEENISGTVYTFRGTLVDEGTSTDENATPWAKTKTKHDDLLTRMKILPKKTISLLLPARYPHSVAPGYLGFVSFGFTASVAGSAAMVLSTQTLLLAVGIVGQGSSGVMAGALNWVMRDFMGQLGGIVFASQMGKTKAFDSDPKRWRMVSAFALDGATMMEIFAPLCHPSLVLPVASIANIGKNISFLTASASRASLHQSLAISGNLGDVTVKAGSQSMMASLAGTSLGIGLSTLLHHDTFNFGMCFVFLSAIHQVCTYLSLQKVPLAHFNCHRLHLVLEEYIRSNRERIPTPADIAKIEAFFPLLSNNSILEWLSIGRPLQKVCQTPGELEQCRKLAPNEAYLIRFDQRNQHVDIIYFQDAEEKDLLRGMYHACLIREYATRPQMDFGTIDAAPADSTMAFADPKDEPALVKRNEESWEQQVVRKTHMQVDEKFPHLQKELREQGWNASSEVTIVEESNSNRISINVT
mmetsp:Transcript_17479/g.48262  ORF Transcript_17479/g.48262 Transcript_17479/m.48262 type:complete len:569 (+) Transcript_17479:115-1821(+)